MYWEKQCHTFTIHKDSSKKIEKSTISEYFHEISTTFFKINDTNKDLLNKSIQEGKLKTKLGIDIVGLEVDNNKPKVNFTDGSTEVFDKIIYAIGGVAPIDFLKKCGLELDSAGVPLVSDSCESSVKNIFVAGDLLFKSGGSIASALNNGFNIVTEIHKRIKV